jgi:hypothetical protein
VTWSGCAPSSAGSARTAPRQPQTARARTAPARRRRPGSAAGPGLPLDIGYARTVPAGIRKAVRLRARGHCEWPGGCSQPAAVCQVHHTTHKANGGTTSLTGCALLCWYHHQVMIHQRGWTLTVNPDGTNTAWNTDKTKVLHSHGPPARTG